MSVPKASRISATFLEKRDISSKQGWSPSEWLAKKKDSQKKGHGFTTETCKHQRMKVIIKP
jgi:hypothetical protein